MRFLAVAAVLLPCVWAQDLPPIDNPLCTEDGIDAFVLRSGVFILFANAELTCNNLGDMGPDTDCPSELRYTNIGTDFGMGFGPGDDVPVDLVVSNTSEYKANNPERNGRTANGLFGQVNLRDDFETTFRWTFVKTGGDPNNPADVVTFTTGVELFVLDIDHGEAGRLTESLKFFPPEGDFDLPVVTSINEACTDQNQPTPCLMTTVFIEQFGSESINTTATDRGTGADNPEFPEQILQPVADMTPFDALAATRYVKVEYPPNMGSFQVIYKITPAANPGSSGRNFQLYVEGMGAVEQAPVPCYFCDPDDPPAAPACQACGGSTIENGEVVLFPTKCPVDPNDQFVLFGPDCPDLEAAICTPDAPINTFPECLETCAATCLTNEPDLCPAVSPAPPDIAPSPAPLPPPSPSPPPSPPMGMARKDPHLYFPHGGRADFRGASNTTFAMLSAKDVAFNVLTEEADFNWAKRLVHGTKMAAAFWVVRTSTGRLLKIELNATSRVAIVHEDGNRDVEMKEDTPALVMDNVQVSFNEQTLAVRIANKWHLSATITAFPFGNRAANKNKRLLDISIDALYDADHDVVAPHGIMGQAYDGDDIAVNGKIDKVHDEESTTSAQAEGAIEGSWLDYKLASPFATDFKYSRFDATEAKPRDVSMLTGEKSKATKGIVGATDMAAIA